jgi:hypothetical protein
MPEPIVYLGHEHPDVQVEVDGQWWPGEARMRTELRDGTHRYDVAWHRKGETYLDDFPAERVRLDNVDRSRGRGSGKLRIP